MEVLQLSTLDQDEATFALRKLFVEELSDNNCSYQSFLTGSKEEIELKVNEFQTTRVFFAIFETGFFFASKFVTFAISATFADTSRLFLASSFPKF